MRLVKTTKSGKIRVDLDVEELQYLDMIASRVGYDACVELCPPAKKYDHSTNDFNLAQTVICHSLVQVMEESGVERLTCNKGYSMRKYTEQ